MQFLNLNLPSHHNKISVIVTDLRTCYVSPYAHTTHNTFTCTMSHPMGTLHTKVLLMEQSCTFECMLVICLLSCVLLECIMTHIYFTIFSLLPCKVPSMNGMQAMPIMQYSTTPFCNAAAYVCISQLQH